MKFLAALVIVLLTSACAPPLPAGDMMPMSQVYSQTPVNSILERKIALGQVSVDESTSSQTAPVSKEVYREALQNTLLTANYATRGDDKPLYTLDARLLELDVPMFGFSMDASAKAEYKLKRTDSNAVVFSKVINLPYHAPFSEAFNGNERARIATAKAIRENITHLIKVLSNIESKDLK